ncbi:MAG: type IV secretory system conjugative DNA transfer family protein [Candidatus Coprovivens sp.]
MNYAQWKNMSELREELDKIGKDFKIEKSGIPLTYDEEHLYFDRKDHHTLVIGTTGSGKTQSIVLPQIKLAMLADESLVIKDNNGELYTAIAGNLEENNYKVYTINFDNSNLSNNWNPLTLPYQLYKEGNVDEAQKILENIGYYLFKQLDTKDVDNFWSTSATQYFVGISLYLFEHGKEDEINFNSIYDITCVGEDKKDGETYFKHILNSLERTSPTYINLVGTLDAPIETRGGILSVFKQIIRLIVSRQNLSSMLSTSDFDLLNIQNEKFAIFMIGEVNPYTIRLEPLFINQLYNSVSLNKKSLRRINVIIDDFESLCPLDNFSALLNSSRGLNLKFTIIIKSLLDLERQYGKEDSEILKYTMGCIIYLLANDLYTCEEICKLCGNKAPGVPLITPEELKLLQVFEAIVLIPRNLPIKTKLLPDYRIPWNINNIEKELPERKIIKHNVFDIKKYI